MREKRREMELAVPGGGEGGGPTAAAFSPVAAAANSGGIARVGELWNEE